MKLSIGSSLKGLICLVPQNDGIQSGLICLVPQNEGIQSGLICLVPQNESIQSGLICLVPRNGKENPVRSSLTALQLLSCHSE